MGGKSHGSGGRSLPDGLEPLLQFGLVEALLGRRSRRFFKGATIPDGVFAFASSETPQPLTELETLLVVGACGANTSWHHMLHRAARYAPHLSNYSGAAGGRTFPSAAGFHTSMTFFTDDSGVYVLDVRDSGSLAARDADGRLGLDALLDGLRGHMRKLGDGRLGLPPEPPFVEPHNTWVVNQPGTLLVIPVADLAQHTLLGLAYLTQNGFGLYDDIHRRPVPGLDRHEGSLIEPDQLWPISLFDQVSMGEAATELSTSCFAGSLMLQAMGLGGWMFDGIDPFSVLGASGDPRAPGLGFRYDEDPRWPTPNVTGLNGVMEAYCPPHHADMRAAVDAMCERKFGPGGPFHPDTPGPWKDARSVRSAAEVHDERFRDCVALQAQYIYDTFGKFPATVPSIYTLTFLQAHHLDLSFYDHYYEPGAYLHTHRDHDALWHQGARLRNER